jgi:hypothetical protein
MIEKMNQDNPVEKLTKLEAARREINAAIRMYFNSEDPVAVHAVVAGGTQIISDLGKRKGLQLGIESGVKHIRPERQKEFREMMREPQNHIKHADHEGDEDKILEYRPATIEFYLYLGAGGYQEYTGMDTPETRVFMWWFAACNPDLLNEPTQKAQVEDMIKIYGKFTHEDKDLMKRQIARLRNGQPLESMDYRP